MRAQKRVEDARERAYACASIRFAKESLRKWMDCRVKPGNDGANQPDRYSALSLR
jgi:hypothetical protein